MVLTKYFLLFGLSISSSKNGLIFKLSCLGCPNYINLHSEIYSMHSFKLFFPSGLTIVAFPMALKQMNFFT